MRARPPSELLEVAALQLGELLPEVVFIGGAVLGLLVTESGARPPRMTKDVDVLIEIGASIVDHHALDRRLLGLGFQNDMTGPRCRYLQGATIIDVIPVDPEDWSSPNCWYRLALTTSWTHTLNSGCAMRVIDPVCFLATKVAAFRDASREYGGDIFLSRDFSDLLQVIDGRPAIVAEVARADERLRGFLKDGFRTIVGHNYLDEALLEHVERGREAVVLERIRALTSDLGGSPNA